MAVAALPDLNRVERVLIVRLSSIGDVIHALPVAAALKDTFPHLELTWLVEEMSAEIVTGSDALHDVLIIPRKRWKAGRWRSPQVWREYLAFLGNLRRRRFDVALDLQGYAKSALLVAASGVPYRIGWWRLRDGANLISRAIPKRPESVHRVDVFLDVARALGAGDVPVRFPFAFPDSARQRVRDLLQAGGIDPSRPYAVLNPSVGSETRRWGPSRYAELAAGLAMRFGLPSVLIGSGKDTPICDAVRHQAETLLAERHSNSGSPAVKTMAPLSLAGQTSLKELAALLANCAVHVCGDTGSAHIGAAVGCPVVAIYGPTDPAQAGPYGQMDSVLSHREFCAPGCDVRQCVHPVSEVTDGTGMDMAAVRTARCLAEIRPEAVLDKVGTILENIDGTQDAAHRA